MHKTDSEHPPALLKAREDRLRRALRRFGLALRKSRVVKLNLDNLGGYTILDADHNYVVAGTRFDLTLEDVERFVQEAVDLEAAAAQELGS